MSESKLTTHILNTAQGCPAAGVRVELWRDGKLLVDTVTNEDGRCDKPLLQGSEVSDGACELRFHIGDYFKAQGIESPFLNVVPISFLLQEGGSYHVPLVCSPWSYATYRGS